jgi:hypothetical protein
MKSTPHEEPGSGPPVPSTQTDSAAFDFIRTETVLSRLPVHNLTRHENVDIRILQKTTDGKLDLKWVVSYSDRYGQAGQLAYKLDTIVINHRIDQQGRPLPKMISLGSLRDIADELDLGGDTNKVRRALRQNASAFITAKFEYRGNDGTRRTLEADFTRYSVVFTGEKLPNGTRADAVYIIFNEPYREVLNNAPVRPLDRAYMKALPPTAQRFYEIISRKIFAALKNKYPYAKMAYSEYCTFSTQARHLERQPVQDQMGKILRPHKKSGYIAAVQYKLVMDTQDQPDWIMCFTPGPKAHAEFAAANPGYKIPAIEIEPEAGEVPQRRSATRHGRLRLAATPPPVDESLVAELIRRGIAAGDARKYLADLPTGFPTLDSLEWADAQIARRPKNFDNPGGFYVSVLKERKQPPPNFLTSRKAREIEAAGQAKYQAHIELQMAEQAAEEEARRSLNAQIAAMTPEVRQALFGQAKKKLLQAYPTRGFQDYVNTSPEALGEEGPVYSRMRQMLKEGWGQGPKPL